MENIEAAMKRIPPHSIEAEQAVLGAMLMNKDAVMTASEIITGEDFYQTAYGIIFDCVVDLFKAGKPVDLITLQEQLKEENLFTLNTRHAEGRLIPKIENNLIFSAISTNDRYDTGNPQPDFLFPLHIGYGKCSLLPNFRSFSFRTIQGQKWRSAK